MPKKLDLWQPEFALRKFSVELMVSKCLEDRPQLLLMFRLRARVDKDVNDKDNENLSKYCRNTLFIRSIKAAGAFVIPNGMTVNSYRPYRVQKAVFGMSSS